MASTHSMYSSLTLKTLCNELENVAYKAHEIGIQLGIPPSKIKTFEKDGESFDAIINHWLNGNVPDVPISWEYLVKTLESNHVGETGLAKEISKKYCQKPKNYKVKSAITDDSIKQVLSGLTAQMGDGIPALKIPPLDPLAIDDFNLEEDSPLVKCRVDFDNVVVTGLSSLKILSVDCENGGLEIVVSASVNQLKATGNYSLEGTAIVFIPLACDGDAIVEAEDASVLIRVSLPTENVPEASIDVSFDVGRLKAYFSDLQGGGDLGNVLNQLLNIFGKEIFKIAEPSISKEVKCALEKLINKEMKTLRI